MTWSDSISRCDCAREVPRHQSAKSSPRRRPVGPEVAAGQLGERFRRLELPHRAGMGEAHPRPLAFGEAELAAVRGRLEQHAPALPENHAELVRAGALADRVGELVAGERAAA